jgi:hypothetical protein
MTLEFSRLIFKNSQTQIFIKLGLLRVEMFNAVERTDRPTLRS